MPSATQQNHPDPESPEDEDRHRRAQCVPNVPNEPKTCECRSRIAKLHTMASRVDRSREPRSQIVLRARSSRSASSAYTAHDRGDEHEESLVPCTPSAHDVSDRQANTFGFIRSRPARSRLRVDPACRVRPHQLHRLQGRASRERIFTDSPHIGFRSVHLELGQLPGIDFPA